MWKLPAANMGHTSTLLTPTPPSSDWSSRLSNRSPTVQSQLSPKMADTITPSRSRISQTQSGTRGNPTPPGTRVDLSSLDMRSGLSPSDTRASQRTSATGRRSFRGGASREVRQVKKDDDIPVFDRNKVSLDFPGNLFGPSVSLLIRTTKIVGDVIQNSAVRYQSFLRLFRPLFRGPFEIKGLDPPTTTTKTTTTKTTTTTTTSVPATDNEVRR
ncbi:hypothetical protein KGM_209045 [Danaus plexippus plexippus]|uniref:Uncharacterized protein n=1 Tax=Danaus plexippus plexippus TaxID=278856 RepID=A0A212FCP4_DANPL|nr:uncharacterized protein LOC116774115 [Danaus plexippus plexippus]OWR51516.1 hypothetical protein KGM_209045 [Danaus plexippus plexippus]